MSQRKETAKEKKLPPHLKAYNRLVDALEGDILPRLEYVLDEYNSVCRGLEGISPVGIFPELDITFGPGARINQVVPPKSAKK